MKKSLGLLLLSLALIFPVFAKKGNKFPKNVRKTVEKVYKEGNGNGIYNIEYLKSLDFKGPLGIYHVVFFKANPPVKEREKFFLYMRFYGKNGKFEDHLAPFSSYEGKFFSVGLSLLPGNYKAIFAIADRKGEKIGTSIFNFEVPALGEKEKITWSIPFFIKKLERSQLLSGITVVPDVFYIGAGKFTPYIENKFSVDEKPELLIYLYGIGTGKDGLAKGNVHFMINKDGEKFVDYNPVSLRGRRGMAVIDQPFVFKKGREPFEKGKYIIVIEIKDLITRKETRIKIPFEII